MTDQVKRTVYAYVTILMIAPTDARAITETMVAPAVQPGYQSLIVNTLLLRLIIPVLEESRLDLEYFRDKTPEVKTYEDDIEPFWLRILEKLQSTSEQTQAETADKIISEHLADADVVEWLADDFNLTTIQPYEQQQTVPGISQSGGNDDAQNKQTKESSDRNSDGKDSQNEKEKQDDSTGASATYGATPSSSLSVIKEDMRPQVTAALKRYNKKEESRMELQQGGYSRVYSVNEDGVVLVIKVPSIPPEEHYRTKRELEEEKQRLLGMSRNEKEILQTLKHENIIKLVAFIETEIPELGKTFLLIMEYAGKDLSYYLKHNFHSIEDHLLFIARSILEGLYYIHQQGLVWGELKSNNVMVSRHGQQIRVRLIDLATCQTPEQRALMKLDDIFTTGWQAPELFPYREGMVVTSAADVYCFGLICAMLRKLHRHKTYLIKQDFKESRNTAPERVNRIILSIMKDSVNRICDLTDDQLASSGNPSDQAIQRLKKGSFLHLMATLATRSIEWRPEIEVIRRYFDLHEHKPSQ